MGSCGDQHWERLPTGGIGRDMERAELIEKMRGRVAMCRRLAKATTDRDVARTLTEMADEGEADIQRLLAEGAP